MNAPVRINGHPSAAALEQLRVNLNDCPPRADGMTDQVIMVIATRADGKHTITGCARIAQRQFQVEQRRGVKG